MCLCGKVGVSEAVVGAACLPAKFPVFPSKYKKKLVRNIKKKYNIDILEGLW